MAVPAVGSAVGLAVDDRILLARRSG